MAAQVMRLRCLLIGGSGGASTSAPAGLVMPLGTPFATLAVGVAALAAPGATRAAGGVPAGVSVAMARAAGSRRAGRPAAARRSASVLALSFGAAGCSFAAADVGGAVSPFGVLSPGVAKLFSLSKRDLRVQLDVAGGTGPLPDAGIESLLV